MGRHPRVLVTGAAGQVGRALAPLLPDARLLGHDDLDVTDRAAVLDAAPEADRIVHLAAMTAVDACEQDPARAMLVNADGTRHVAEAARRQGARVIYLSTDYVFDGSKNGPYEETDQPRPLNAYGRSKLEGERYVLEDEGNLVVRTSWVIGEGNNFVRTILRAAQDNPTLTVVDDQHGRPTFASDLARALVALLDAGLGGIFHVTGDGPACTWADLAERALAEAGSPATVTRVDTPTFERSARRPMAPRPRNSVLSLSKARSAGIPLADWRQSLSLYLRNSSR